jgi:hypothetical protein
MSRVLIVRIKDVVDSRRRGPIRGTNFFLYKDGMLCYTTDLKIANHVDTELRHHLTVRAFVLQKRRQ